MKHMRSVGFALAAAFAAATAPFQFRAAMAAPPADEASIGVGMKISCKAKFLKVPTKGYWTIARKDCEYWLRYEVQSGQTGRFQFFVYLEGKWEPRVAVQKDVSAGRTYAVSAEWDGLNIGISVDGEQFVRQARRGRCFRTSNPLHLGERGRIEVSGFVIANEPKVFAVIGELRTKELMPRNGSPVTLLGKLSNIGAGFSGGEVEAVLLQGVSVAPGRASIPPLAENAELPLEWRIDAGTNSAVELEISLRAGGKLLARERKRIVVMPERDPDLSAKAWSPPVSPGRTYHVDSDSGDDGNDGLSQARPWRTFANAKALTLGPGERLLLKRGCVFDGELRLKARGSADNWAEIGAYGDGARPRIRRRRHINDRCGLIKDPSFLAVRDIIFSDAGMGLMLVCDGAGSGTILVERCLMHHIEGMYRFNAHGLPDWRDEPGAPCPGNNRSVGLHISGKNARHAVVRDCEMYQCSGGYFIYATDVFVNRVFCHDNFTHNTSPHPYFGSDRAWMTDCVFDASGWQASAGTMGVMLCDNNGLVIRGCHFLNQPDSGSADQGGIDFEARGENCLIDECTFRNNAGAAIEVLGLRHPQTRNIHIRRCRFDRNNYARKNGPCEIQVWGTPNTSRDIACSNGRIEDNGYVTIPGIPFYVNNTQTTNDWILAGNRRFDFPEDLYRAYPYPDPPEVSVCGEIWTDETEVALIAKAGRAGVKLFWEQTEGSAGVSFRNPSAASTKAVFPGPGDYRVQLNADNGRLWRSARTAVHVLPKGYLTFKTWDFSKNLDVQGWRVERAGTSFEFIRAKSHVWSTKSYPVHMVGGDYLITAIKNSADACITTPDGMSAGVLCSDDRVNTVRIKMQNRTNSPRMRLWWQVDGVAPKWDPKNSVAIDVKPMDDCDSVYEAELPPCGPVKQFRLSFSADGRKVSGTCRIDYIWLGRKM